MISLILVLLAGIGLGYALRALPVLHKTESSISYTILVLLFVLGNSIGSNKLLVANLSHFGWQALILAAAGTTGSVLAAWLVFHLFFRKKGGQA